MSVFKFSDLTRELPYRYPNLWFRQKTTGPARLVLAPAEHHVGLMLDLTRQMDGPFGVLYVLIVPRTDHPAGRYQIAEPLEMPDMEAFLCSFAEFFENDGRHHVWVMSVPTGWQVIYDNHNVIYAYGDFGRFQKVAEHWGLKHGEVRFPCPHSHLYNAEYDREEERILAEYAWRYFPLQPVDDP